MVLEVPVIVIALLLSRKPYGWLEDKTGQPVIGLDSR